MNDQGKYNRDLLREYIAPGKIEKAPDGFTSKVMAGIHLDTQHLISARNAPRKDLVPIISVGITCLLLGLTFLIPADKSDSLTLHVLNLLKNIKTALPEINLSSISNLTLPSVSMYALLGIFVLAAFDKALYVIFHRGK